MKLSLPMIAASSLLATAAFAQTPPADPAAPAPTAPAERVAPAPDAAPAPSESMPAPSDSTAAPSDSTAAPSDSAAAPSDSKMAAGPTLSDDEAKDWINKVVYSSDDKNVGEIAAIERDPSGVVKEIHADIGGFLGLGETRVRLTPSQFKFVGDRVVLNVTSEAAKSLPKVEG